MTAWSLFRAGVHLERDSQCSRASEGVHGTCAEGAGCGSMEAWGTAVEGLEFEVCDSSNKKPSSRCMWCLAMHHQSSK